MRQAISIGPAMLNLGPDHFDATTLGTGGALVTLIGALIGLRRLFSKEITGVRGDKAERSAIDRLETLLKAADDRNQELITQHAAEMVEMRTALREAVARADQFARERNDAIRLIGELNGKIEALQGEVSRLRDSVEKHNQPGENREGILEKN
jgi:chromosome segregation ATPase